MQKIPTTHAFLHQIMVMASGVGDSSKNSRGLFLQLRNVSSADLLWDEKKVEKGKLMFLLIILPWKG